MPPPLTAYAATAALLPQNHVWNTVGDAQPIFDDATGEVHILFTVNNQRILHMSTPDAGERWTKARDITGRADVPESTIGGETT